MWNRNLFLRGRHAPVPASSEIFGTLHTVRPNGLTDSDEILCGNTFGIGACFWRISHAPTQGAGPQRLQHFLCPSTYTQRFDLKRQIGVITHVGLRVSRGSANAPLRRGRGFIVPRIVGFLHAYTQYEKQQPNFARWSNYMWGNILHVVDHEYWRAICLRCFLLTQSRPDTDLAQN